MRVVIIGGFGNFGARICRRLHQETGFEIVATSRRPNTALEFVKTAALDMDSPTFAAQLKALHPDLVIHCAGPFQNQDYRVALATMACDAHYIDIADGRDFVSGFVGAVGPAAKSAGRFAITGASTLPALSSAVVDSLKHALAHLSAIDTVIAPGQHARRGAATVAAVLGYAGQAFPWWQDGEWRTIYGWQELKREHFSFGRRFAAACDVPDLELLPVRYPGIKTVTFRVALEVSMQHYALWIIAVCRRAGMRFSTARWSTYLDRVGTWLNWLGGDTGGMMVRVVGTDYTGRRICRTWELIAQSNHGPEIPCMAAVILANRLRQGDAFTPGAHVCMGILGLPDFESEFSRWNINTQVSEC